MKSFSLEEYIKNPNKKIVTGKGKNVRIICTNRLSDTFPVVALVYNGADESIQGYTKDGKIMNKYPCFEYDLFFAPVKKSGWMNLYKINSEVVPGAKTYNTEEEAKSRIGDRPNYISTVKLEWEE